MAAGSFVIIAAIPLIFMPLYWDDDEEDLTEIEYRKKKAAPEEAQAPAPAPRGKEESRPPPQTPPPPVYSPLPEFKPSPQAPPPPKLSFPPSFQPAPLKDRFAAFLLDSLVGFYLYWITGYFLLKFFGMGSIPLLQQNSGRLAIHIFLTTGALFFYYVVMESVFGATLGKFFCRLRVLEENGQGASLGNIFMRNILRIADYPFAFLIAVISMESSPLHQRLGDRAAKTVVIKKSRRLQPAVDLARTPLASTLSRLFAELLDLILVLLWLYSLVLLMRPSRPLLSYVLFISLPILFVLYYTFLEFLGATTPGKALFKRTVVQDNGDPPDGTSSLIRNLFRPFDYVLGYPLLVLSKRKQRLGDMAADTLVVARPAPAKGKWVSLLAVGLVLATAYFGFRNPNNFIRLDYGLGPWEGWKVFVPKWRPKGTPAKPAPSVAPAKAATGPVQRSALPASTTDQLKLAEFYFAAGPEPGQIRNNTVFRAGDLIYAFFKVQGFGINPEGSAAVSQDLVVEDPAGQAILNLPKIVEYAKPIDPKVQGVMFANHLKLPPNPPPGQYRAVFTLRDQNAGTEFSFEKFFEIK